MNFLLKRILMRGLFAFALLAVGGLPSVSAQTQTTLPPCTMDILETEATDDGVPAAMDIDKDGDNLIEICDLEGLDAIRNNLTGLGTAQQGCATTCTGFELIRSLDFMDASSYRSGNINTAWTRRSGWLAIGRSETEFFSATFDGNGHTISNLFIDRFNANLAGFFGWIVGGKIANLGLLDVNITGAFNVGGLASYNLSAITNSYVTGRVSGSIRVGGLVGLNTSFSDDVRGSITNSYATASVLGSVSGASSLGGLVGVNSSSLISNSITNSYATGAVEGTGTNIGGLVGQNASMGTIENSYATGMVTGSDATVGGLVGLNDNPNGIEDSYWLRDSASSGGSGVDTNTSRTATELRLPTTPTMTTYTNWRTADWDFGSDMQYPVIRYATECVKTTVKSDTGQPICGDLLAKQEGHELPSCTASLDIPNDNDGISQVLDVDKDGDGLIEICDLEGLDEMRYELDGTGYSVTDIGRPITTGCPTGGCTGYELAKDLDFTEASSYREGSINTAWTDTSEDGWEPIGDGSNSFAAAFDGNGHTISNLMIDRGSSDNIGLFGFASGAGNRIANLGLLEVNVTGRTNVGGLVGDSSSRIANSYVTGSVMGTSNVGGLVGANSATITNSYATASVRATATTSSTGGLVGRNDGTIADSYATGEVGGGSNIGGLAGSNGMSATIRNSYATGEVRGSGATVGGLVGNNTGTNNNTGTITNSYWLDSSASSGGNGVPAGTSRTAMELTSPTAPGATSTDTYHNWRTMIWDFGTSTRYPALRYERDCVNRDENTEKPAAGQPTCGNGLPNQEVDLIQLPPCTIDIPDTDDDDIDQAMDVDKDNDGLIEICDLEGLFEIRHQLDGSGYRLSADANPVTMGCPSTSCTGFELTKSLDFSEPASYRSGRINPAWTTGQGWRPIGSDSDIPFLATFNGNGYTISNLMINRSTDRIGLFGYAQPPSGDTSISIANLGLLNVNTTGTFYVGSLIGQTTDVMIINSYATGSVVGTDEFVGGLVGRTSGPTMNSYAAVSVSAPNGDVGGLIGHNFGATITNSYATGTVGGTGDNRGGLVGFNQGGTIRNSYATGRVIAGSDSDIGGLVGLNNEGGTITRSYWDSQTTEQATSGGGMGRTTMALQRPTAATGIYTGWGTANWDFGTSLQYPILKYAAGNLTGDLIGDLIPGQGTGLRSLQPSTAGAEFITTFGEATAFSEATTRHTIAVPPGTSEIGLTLTAYNSTSTIAVVKEGESNDFFAGMGSGDNVSVPIATNPVLIITVSEPNLEPIVYRVVVTALPSCTFGIDVDDTDEIDQIIDIDKDGDGLIEICDLEGLDEMRHQLDGTGYNATDGGTAITAGCPSSGCNGYELANSLDFMDDGSYRAGSRNNAWTSGAGWQPVGDNANSFAARFNGNGYTISNLMINRDSNNIGLFGGAFRSRIANLGLLDVDITGLNDVGGLVGNNFAPITNSYVTGSVSGSSQVGGLVGDNTNNITNSYATASVTGSGDNVGGLVGNNSIFIISSYATGRVEGSDSSSNVGGLVGNNGGTIRNSYATGMVIGSGATVGGLVGNNTGPIIQSYWLDSSASSGGSGVPANTSRTALQLASPTTTAITYTNWAPDVWDFGRSFEYPALKYAGDDCADPETTSVKSDTGPPICGTLLAGDQPVSIVRLLPRCTGLLIDIYPDDGDGVPQFMDVDKDNDGLIEICDLEGLDEIRHRLNGSGYRTTAGATIITMGCLGGGDCSGYELTKDLDFMDDASYRDTANKATYMVSNYDDSDDTGWDGIGRATLDENTSFNAKFDGNGYTISNLMINRTTVVSRRTHVGLFSATASSAEITNLGLLDVNVQGQSSVAGLVGSNGGTITNSYVTGSVLATGSTVGGLVGNNTGTITNSYAAVSVSGLLSNIGGLVGFNNTGTITNSYATGIVTGTGTRLRGNIGGLVGGDSNGTITNSYARGEVRATVARATIGGLAGNNGGTITDSYWLSGSASSGGTNVPANTEKDMDELQEPTTAIGIYENWNTTETVAWDFGTRRQYPILKYPDGNLIPNQGIGLRSLQTSTTGAELIPPLGGATTRHAFAVPPGTSSVDLTLTTYNPTAMIEVVNEGEPSTDYFTGKDGRGSVSVPIATNPVLIITVSEADLEEVVYRVVVTTLPPCTASLGMNIPDDNDGVEQALDIDKDGDGLIEICDLEGLDAMRHQLDGTGYRTTSNAMIITAGCRGGGDCTGYELTKSLDFMDASSYRSGSRNTAWTMGAGWQPIGTSSEVFFSARFEGNGHTISNLMIDRSGENNIGLFGVASGDRIANIGLRNVDISGQNAVGGLVGSNSTTITNSYVTGEVKGRSQVGGLVGDNSGAIMSSYATAAVEGTGANVGGLVGRNSATIMNSYATGRVTGSANNGGGLVGNNQSAGSIRNSYATGRVIGSGDTVGGLVGDNAGTITGGYWLSSSASGRGTGDTTSISTTSIALISPTAPTTTTYAGWDTNVWDFGNDEQFPALRYAAECINREITTVKSDTGQPICEEPLPNQQVELQNQFLPPCTNALALIDDYLTDNDEVPQRLDVDKDDDGLIEICDLEGLFEMRYQLDGMSYTTTGTDAMSITTGCRTTPTTGCTGFELTRDLDFNDPNSYRSGSINTAWTDGAGWDPIGVSTSTSNAFSATFDGNGYTIANLLINRPTDGGVGFFRGITGRIDDIRLADVRVTGATNTAGLAGVSLGTINNAYVSGTISGTGDNVGGLVGNNAEGDGITNSYTIVTVSGNGNDSIGGLVGYNQAPITNSYAIADVSGNDSIGGLVGENEESSAMIRNSFALATVRGNSSVGGLVGFLDDGSIFNGYARGLVSAEMTDVGGLVGVIANAGQVDNSYSNVEVVGGATVSNIGGLVGRHGGNADTDVINSYWDRQTSGQNASAGGTGEMTMELQEPITATGIYEDWNTTTTIAWDFGSAEQYPRLRYAKGADENNPACFEDDSNSDEGLPKCGDLLSGQDNFLPQCTISLNTTDDNDGVLRVIDIDKDDDGLIEICDLEGLDEMRYQLDGMGYKTTDSETVVPITSGCATTCTGFELTKSLDFMDDNSYRNTINKVTWTVANYDDDSDTGWQPIGGDGIARDGSVDNPSFNARLEGNGYTIANLMINRRETSYIGLFGSIQSEATIANLGLLDVNIMGQNTLGSLVGQSYAGTVINSYATGRVTGSTGIVGGLVGWNGSNATIRNSYAAVSISASKSEVNGMGGLVGTNNGMIDNSYATGSVNGNNQIGGLVGDYIGVGPIVNSYAIGRVTGTGDNIGGLVGANAAGGTITGSYWLSRPGISGGTRDTTSTPQTVTMLTSPTMPTTTTYTGWLTRNWDFGTANQYPALKYAEECVEPPDTDTTPVKLQTGQPICGTLLSDDQPVDASIRLRVKVFLEGPLQ